MLKLVSGEAADGTIKLLLTRNVPRWKILLSKYLALIIMEVIVLILALIISVMVSGIFFGYGGWMTPVATGFAVVGDKLNTLGVQNAPPVAIYPDGLRPGWFCSASSWEHCFHDLGTGEEYSCLYRDYDGCPDWGQLSQLLYG